MDIDIELGQIRELNLNQPKSFKSILTRLHDVREKITEKSLFRQVKRRQLSRTLPSYSQRCGRQTGTQKTWTFPVFDPKKPAPTVKGLTWKGLKYNFLVLKLLTLIKILPTEFDLKTGQMHRNDPETARSRFLYGFWRVFLALRIILLVVDVIWQNMLQNIFRTSEVVGFKIDRSELYRNIFTVFWTAFVIGLYYGYHMAVVLGNHVINNVMWNLLVESRKEADKEQQQQQNEEVLAKAGQKSGVLRKILESIKSWAQTPVRVHLLNNMTWMVYSMAPALLSFAIVDPQMPILLTSKAVTMDLGPIVYWPLAVLDILAIFGFVSLIHYAVFYMHFFILQVGENIQMAIYKLSKTKDSEAARRSLQSIHVMMRFFNLTVSSVVYLTKLIAISAAIVGGFGFIKLIHTSTFFSGVCAIFFLEGNVLYILLFDKIHGITASIEQLKWSIINKSDQPKNDEKYYKKVCSSVRMLEVTAGGFYFMERENSLFFGDFVAQKIVSLLLVF